MNPDNPQPLPVRIDPEPDETFYSYIHRVASHLLVSPQVLLRPFFMRTSSPTSRPIQLRQRCLAVTEQNAKTLGAFFHLDPNELNGMFGALSQQASSPPSTKQRQAWDAFDADRRYPVPSVPTEYVAARLQRVCRRCQKTNRTHWQVSWQFTYQVTCRTHHCYLTNQSVNLFEAPWDVCAAEATVLDIANSKTAAPHGMSREIYLCTVSDSLIKRQRALNRKGHRSPHYLGPALLEIVDSLASQPSTVQYPFYNSQSSHGLLEDPQVGIPVTVDPLEAVHFPDVLPCHLYYGALSDLAYPTDLYLGRVIAAAHCKGQNPLASAATSDALANATASLMTRLELDGRLEDWWTEIEHTIQILQVEHDKTSNTTKHPSRPRGQRRAHC